MSVPSRKLLEPLIDRFSEEHPPGKTVFVIMRFARTLLLNRLFEVIDRSLSEVGACAVRADAVSYSPELWTNVETCIRGADAGIAVIDRIPLGGQVPESFNANVLLETGYMLGLDKPVLLLKERNAGDLPVDLGGLIFQQFDGDNPDSAAESVRVWASRALAES